MVRSSTGIASNHYGTVMRFGWGKMILLDNDADEIIDDDTSSNVASDK